MPAIDRKRCTGREIMDMTQQTAEQAIGVALEHHRSGRLAEAERIYRQILASNSAHPVALHLLGMVAFASGRNDDAIALIGQALCVCPDYAGAHCNLGLVLTKQRRFSEAVASCRRAIEIRADYPEALNNLGDALDAMGEFDQAVVAFQRAIELRPSYASAHNNLGSALTKQKKYVEAIAALRRAASLDPTHALIQFNLGNALRESGDLDEAIIAYGRAIKLNPALGEAYLNLGVAKADQGKLDEAITAYTYAIQCDGRYAKAHYNLANALREDGRVDAAIEAYSRAILHDPSHVDAYINKGNLLKDVARHDESLGCFEAAIALEPENQLAHSNLLYGLYFHPRYDTASISQAVRNWNDRFARPLHESSEPLNNDPNPDRRLRVGYVSPDFREHAESFFTVPLLAHHNHETFEVFCYSNVRKADGITDQIRAYADVWREVRNESDESLARIIREDRIDILVDLSMHMAGNRPLVFARKPAPVRVCWLAYPGSMGSKTVDYRITDTFLDPIGSDVPAGAERSFHLPDCWVVYNPLIDLPPRPPEQIGAIRFGSLNNPCKLNEPLLKLWATVLQANPDSKLTLSVLSSAHRSRIVHFMQSLGIREERLEFVGRLKRPQYLRCYDQIDIALDPLPYNGITTSCDALYMGVPLLTLAGHTAAGRAGKGMLTALGLSELVAHSPDEFVQRATELANDRQRLIDLRKGLRDRMVRSPLMEWPNFARNMESAYRQMWYGWSKS